MSNTSPPELHHRVMAGFIGNVVEWYNFALYGYLAGVISPVFFPEASRAAGLIATYGIFAAGFIMRLLGAAALVTNVFSHATVENWVWRLPFIGGDVLGGIAILLR